jgi:polyphosphate kinase 2 (PPK2 family)
VIPVAAPTDEERAHHYLWRFWRNIPSRGNFTIYDRSWYGRVLVERVEGFATAPEWRRAYKEINDFEEHMVGFGIVLAKFWLHISRDEQLRRFEEREAKPWKRHKITEEDYRNRDKIAAYELAADEMIGRTSTEFAPWTLVEANDKLYARIKVLQTVCERLERALDHKE